MVDRLYECNKQCHQETNVGLTHYNSASSGDGFSWIGHGADIGRHEEFHLLMPQRLDAADVKHLGEN